MANVLEEYNFLSPAEKIIHGHDYDTDPIIGEDIFLNNPNLLDDSLDAELRLPAGHSVPISTGHNTVPLQPCKFSSNRLSSSNMSHYIKVDLPKFKGLGHENADRFLNEFESFAILNALDNDSRKIAAFHLHLQGPALIWFNSLDSEIKMSWNSLEDVFRDRYILSDSQSNPQLRQRTCRKPVRYRDSDHVDPQDLTELGSSSCGYQKIKRVLGQRQIGQQTEYLVHIRGEPSQKAFWVTADRLDAKARRAIRFQTPPIIG